MIKKMAVNLVITLVLFAVAHGYVWYSEGFDNVKSGFIEYWWVWVLLPFALRLYAWFRNLKRKAFNYGAGIKENQPKE